MRTLHLAFVIFFATVSATAIFSVGINGALADSRCECFCAGQNQVASNIAGPGSFGTPQMAPVNGPKFDSGSVADQSACQAQCAATKPGTGYTSTVFDSCIQAACWCKGSQGNVVQSATSKDGCTDTCQKAGQAFVSWGNTPPSSGTASVTACPPGGIWTPTDCAAAKNDAGALIGVWKGKDGAGKDQTPGPYCYYNNAPVKLGVALGGLTQANIAQYLSMAYNVGLGVAAILAVIFIMVGGFRYLSAAGGSGVEAGKDMIKNAVIGLVLAALSYTLLQTVNPDILSLRLPTVQLVKQCDVPPIDCGSRKDQKTCEDNSKDSSKKCSWNINQSICIDLATTQSGSPGQAGGECKPIFSCKDGSTCKVGTDSNTGTNKCAPTAVTAQEKKAAAAPPAGASRSIRPI